MANAREPPGLAGGDPSPGVWDPSRVPLSIASPFTGVRRIYPRHTGSDKRIQRAKTDLLRRLFAISNGAPAGGHVVRDHRQIAHRARHPAQPQLGSLDVVPDG